MEYEIRKIKRSSPFQQGRGVQIFHWNPIECNGRKTKTPKNAMKTNTIFATSGDYSSYF